MTTQIIPLPGSDKPLQIDGPFPLTFEQWDHAIAVLDAMRPGLVQAPADGGTSPEDDTAGGYGFTYTETTETSG